MNKENPVGKLCTQCDTEIWAEPKTHLYVFTDHKTGKKVERSIETQVWCCNCGMRIYEDALEEKRKAVNRRYHH